MFGLGVVICGLFGWFNWFLFVVMVCWFVGDVSGLKILKKFWVNL